MARRSEAFGRLLKAGISSIAYVEGKTAPVVEEELGGQVGVTSFTIQRYKAGNLPPASGAVRVLAEACVQRGLLGRPWLERFLHAAGFPAAEALLQQLCPAPPASAPAPGRPTSLPPPLSAPLAFGGASGPPEQAAFVGRAAELATYADRLQRERLVIIAGMPGVGKTSLMAELARRAAAPEHICWYRCRHGDGVDALVAGLAAFLAWRGKNGPWALLQEAGRADGRALPDDLVLDYVVRLLREGRYLLCVDDAHLVIEEPPFARLIEQLRAAGAVRVILATRRTPAFARLSEVEILTGLSLADAGLLLEARAVALSDPELERLYAQTHGNAQFLILALDAIGRSDDPGRVLDDLAAADDVERYLLHEVDAGLSSAERLVMRAVAALLEYGGAREALEALLDAGLDEPESGAAVGRPVAQLSLDRRRLRAALVALCDRCLLLRAEGASGREYQQHAVVRTFYYAELSRPERLALHRRAGVYYAAAGGDVLRAALHYEAAGEPARAVDLATADVWPSMSAGHAQLLRSLLERLSRAGLDPRRQLALSLALGAVSTVLRQVSAARSQLETALSLALAQLSGPERHLALAQICRGMGELLEPEDAQAALAWLQRGLEAAQGVDAAEEARLLIRISSVQIGTGELGAARAVLERSLHVLPPEAEVLRADVLLNLGTTYGTMGDLEQAVACLVEALQIYQRKGDRWCEAIVRQSLGMARTIQGDWPGAAAEYRQALAIAEQFGSPARLADLTNNLGWLRARQGAYREARSLLEQSAALAQNHGLRENLVYVRTNLAALAIVEQDWEAADTALRAAEELALELGVRGELPEIYRSRALICLAQGAGAQAHNEVTQALTIARELEDPLAEGASLRVAGQVRLVSGDPGGALAAFATSAALLAEDPFEQARTHAAWGRALLAMGAGGAADLLQQARAAFARLGAAGELEYLGENLSG